MRFLKGHGTENDFVLLPDLDGRLALTPALVRRLCDRRAGVGADGLLRIVPAALEPDGRQWADDAHWFMDYRNADGSVAEMCGNGLRVFVAFLVDAGLTHLADGEHLDVATRAGVLRVHRVGEDLMAEMGRWDVPGGTEALTRTTAVELAPYGIRVNTLVPGLIATFAGESEASLQRRHDTVPLGRGGVAEDLAGPAVFLASADAAYVTGSTLVVDGGVLVQQRSPQVDTLQPKDYPTLDQVALAHPDHRG